MAARVVVVGLGPAGPDLVTTGTLAAIERCQHRYLRTNRHPSASLVPGAESFDSLYERAATMDDVYAEIVEELVAAAQSRGEVLYAVPGSPAVAEHTVELLLIDDRVEVEVVPALSFVDLAWARLGVDPFEVGARLVDGHRFASEAAGERGPLLVAQCDRRSVLSAVKLSVDEPPELSVTVLARLGLPDESIVQVDWADLDRVVDPDHLTSLWIPELAAPIAGEVALLDELVATLRAECPWDREQTHRSLSPHLVEESYELLEVLDSLPDGDGAEVAGEEYDRLEEELGDVLLQVLLHTRLATEAGAFNLADVARRLHDKLVLRHPHVFGSVEVSGPQDVAANWEQIKKVEEGKASTFDGVPAALPALARASKVAAKAERLGLAAPPQAAAADQAVSRLGIEAGAAGAAQLGEVLFALCEAAGRLGVDAEEALRSATLRREEQYRAQESRAT